MKRNDSSRPARGNIAGCLLCHQRHRLCDERDGQDRKEAVHDVPRKGRPDQGEPERSRQVLQGQEDPGWRARSKEIASQFTSFLRAVGKASALNPSLPSGTLSRHSGGNDAPESPGTAALELEIRPAPATSSRASGLEPADAAGAFCSFFQRTFQTAAHSFER